MLRAVYIYTDLKVSTIRGEITKLGVTFRDKITHPNELASHYLKKKSLED
jgi:hypothetical protein